MNDLLNKTTHHKADCIIDITADTCPMTFVKTKLQIEKMEAGQILNVILNEGEPLKNVPLSAQELGHTILSITPQNKASTYIIQIQKKN
jgi:tRNA 2-thiouridine synthesizing protein A